MIYTVTDIEERVKAISMIASDAESAHSAEDDLYIEVLEAIAQGVDDGLDPRSPAALARAALKAQEIPFPRWCA